MGDMIVVEPAMRFAKLHQAAGGQVFTYVFEAKLEWEGRGDDEISAVYGRMGATHGADVPYLYGTLDVIGLENQSTKKLSAQMQGMLCGFAYCGAPGSVGWMPRGMADYGIGAWPAYTVATRKTKVLGGGGGMKRLLLESPQIEATWEDIRALKSASKY